MTTKIKGAIEVVIKEVWPDCLSVTQVKGLAANGLAFKHEDLEAYVQERIKAKKCPHDVAKEFVENLDKDAEIYPCADCGLLRSISQGASVFTVCDTCWDKKHRKSKTFQDFKKAKP